MVVNDYQTLFLLLVHSGQQWLVALGQPRLVDTTFGPCAEVSPVVVTKPIAASSPMELSMVLSRAAQRFSSRNQLWVVANKQFMWVNSQLMTVMANRQRRRMVNNGWYPPGWLLELRTRFLWWFLVELDMNPGTIVNNGNDAALYQYMGGFESHSNVCSHKWPTGTCSMGTPLILMLFKWIFQTA